MKKINLQSINLYNTFAALTDIRNGSVFSYSPQWYKNGSP